MNDDGVKPATIHRYHSNINKALRHAVNVSLLLANGTTMKEAQEWLGHSSYNVTANTYAHVPSTAKERQLKALESVLHKSNCS